MKRLLAVAAILLSGCSSAPDEAVAAIFEQHERTLFTYCLEVQKNDPTSNQLALIHKFNKNVVPASNCVHQDYGYKTKDGRDAHMVAIVEIRRISPITVKISVADISGFMLGSSGGVYTVERLSGFWVESPRLS